jgi:hypothetical protein
MEFDEAKNLLKEGYISKGFELVDEHSNEVFFKLKDINIIVSEEDIREYCSSFDYLRENAIESVNCGICGPKYCELIIQPLGTNFSSFFYLSRLSRESGAGIVFGEPSKDEVYAEIGLASCHFINFYRFDDKLSITPYPVLLRSSRFRKSEEQPSSLDVRSAISKPTVIKIYNIPEETTSNSLKYSIDLIESCLFELAYLSQITCKIMDEWPSKKILNKKQVENLESTKVINHNLPRGRFNSDLIKYYQLGTSNDIPILQFLVYYQILEYFFIKISEGELHSKIASRLNDPRFKSDEKNLGKLIQDIVDYKRVTDETEMLKQVIKKYVSPSELIDFIQSYEKEIGDKVYSKAHSRFGHEQKVTLEEGHVIGNVAIIIKTVRNALVHSSDHHERQERFIPFSKSTEIVIREIPLVKFLAEKVIIGSSTV